MTPIMQYDKPVAKNALFKVNRINTVAVEPHKV